MSPAVAGAVCAVLGGVRAWFAPPGGPGEGTAQVDLSNVSFLGPPPAEAPAEPPAPKHRW